MTRSKRIVILTGGILLLCLLTVALLRLSFSTTKVHFSIDDCSDCFTEITSSPNCRSSLFDYPYWHFYKKIHDLFGCKVTLYVYSQSFDDFVKWGRVNYWHIDSYANELRSNSDWLKLGFHSIDNSNPLEVKQDWESGYEIFHNDLEQLGLSSSESKILRLSYFHADRDEIEMFREKGICRFLSADDSRVSYDLSANENQELISNEEFSKNGVIYYKTDFRVEGNQPVFRALMENIHEEMFVIFTHEWALDNAVTVSTSVLLFLLSISKAAFIA